MAGRLPIGGRFACMGLYKFSDPMRGKNGRVASTGERYNAMAHKKLKIDKALIRTITRLAKTGATNADISKALGIAERTLYRLLEAEPGLSDALKTAKLRTDLSVENSLLKRALGGKETTISTKTLANGDVVETITVKDVAPDVAACIRWLSLRLPDKWREKPEQTGESAEELQSMISNYIDLLSGRTKQEIEP